MNKQATIDATLDIIRAMYRSANIKISRGFADFLADKFVQASTESNLMGFVERISKLLDSELRYISAEKTNNFMAVSNNDDAEAVINWFCEYNSMAAMIVIQKDDDSYEACKSMIKINDTITEKGVALNSKTPDIPIEIKCLSHLTHGADMKAGNATLFRRIQVLSTTDNVLSLPIYSGNAIRGQIRDLLADHYLETLGFTPNRSNPPCALWFFHALYAGGALEENAKQAKLIGQKLGSKGTEKAVGFTEFRNNIPPLSLLGSALGNRIISGKIKVCDFRPCCKEWSNGDISVNTLFDWIYLTRREDHEAHEDGKNSSMITNTECLKAGTRLLGGVDTDKLTQIEVSCLKKGLYLLNENGYIGADNRRGMGQVSFSFKPEHIEGHEEYDKYLVENRDVIITYLNEIGALNK